MVMFEGFSGFPGSQLGKEATCNAEDPSLIPGSGRSAGERIGYPLQYSWASPVAQLVKNLPAMPETWVRSLGWEDSLEKGKTTHSRIPWTVYSPWCHKESDTTEQLSLFTPRAEGIQFGNEWRCSSLKCNWPGFCIYLDGPQWPAPSVCRTAAPGRLQGIYWRWRRAPGLPRSWWIKPVSFRGSCATPVACSSLNPPALRKSFTPMGTFEFDKWHCLPGDERERSDSYLNPAHLRQWDMCWSRQ